MKKNIIYIIMGTLLVSCGNKKVDVQKVFEDDQTRWGRNAEKQQEQREKEVTLAELGGDMQKEQGEKTSDNNAYKEWKYSHPKDEFGDINNNVGIITMYLDAYRPDNREEKDRISIDYCFDKQKGIEYLIFSSTQLDSYSEISIKMQDGSQQVFHGANTGGNRYGAVTFVDLNDMKIIANILNEGNFKLKVGGRVTDVTNETRGFRNSVEKYFKGEYIEILLPVTTRDY